MQNFDTPTPITAIIDIPAGRIEFIAADRGDTTVEVWPATASTARDVKAAERTTVEYRDGVLRIETTSHSQILGPSGSVAVTVNLPTGSQVTAKAAGAELHSVGRLGEVVIDGAYGAKDAIKPEWATSARLSALAGDISVGRLGGPAEISTGKGDIRISEAVRGTIVLRTRVGDVSIDAAHGVSATLDASTGYGRIDNGRKNDGAAELEVHATSDYGNITARSL